MLYFLFVIIGAIISALLLLPQLQILKQQNNKTINELKQEIFKSAEIAAQEIEDLYEKRKELSVNCADLTEIRTTLLAKKEELE